MATERPPSIRLQSMTAQEIMAWIPGASLEDLSEAMAAPVHQDLLRAIRDETHSRAMDRQAKEANALAAEIRNLTSQIRWLTWLVAGLGGAALLLAWLKP